MEEVVGSIRPGPPSFSHLHAGCYWPHVNAAEVPPLPLFSYILGQRRDRRPDHLEGEF